MRRYSVDQEERILAQAMVKEWTRSKLLDAAQGARLEGDLQVDLRRTNGFLRATLALFTAIIVIAAVALFITVFEVREDTAIAIVTVLAALACLAAADFLGGAVRLYRFGVEEMLAVAAVALLAFSVAELMGAGHAAWSERYIAALAIGAAGGLGLYLRFGFVYAAVAGLASAAAIPFQGEVPAALSRALAAAICAGGFIVARARARQHRDDYQGEDYRVIEAAAWAGVYLSINVQITPGWSSVSGWFYWCTYAITWVLPPLGIWLGIRDRDHIFIDVSALLLLVTMITSKPYLGWTRNTWDPIVLGVVLIGTAVALRRWLASGPGGERRGFTPIRLLDQDGAVLSLLASAAAVQPGHHSHAPAPEQPSQFGGGRSGGGGAGAGY